MANKEIQKAFKEGINEVFSIMFTDGVEDGIYFYRYADFDPDNIYGEKLSSFYKQPILLVAKPMIVPTLGEEYVESIKDRAKFIVPYKSLEDNQLKVGKKDLREYRKGMIRYGDTYYRIDNIVPSTFLENMFMTYVFECTQSVEVDTINVRGAKNGI